MTASKATKAKWRRQKRNQRERAKHMPLDHGTPELMRHRAEVVHFNDVRRQEAGDELGILVLNGVISQSQRAAGIEYARLRSAVCGSPHCATAGYGERHEPSRATGPSAADERNWKRCVATLKGLGAAAKSEVDSVAVFNRRPAWFRRPDRPREGDERRIELLKRALNGLASAVPYRE